MTLFVERCQFINQVVRNQQTQCAIIILCAVHWHANQRVGGVPLVAQWAVFLPNEARTGSSNPSKCSEFNWPLTVTFLYNS